MTSVSPSQEIARAAHAWPFEEARKVLARVEKRAARGNPKDYVLFDRGSPVVYTPRVWALVMLVIRWLPRSVMRRIDF